MWFGSYTGVEIKPKAQIALDHERHVHSMLLFAAQIWGNILSSLEGGW